LTLDNYWKIYNPKLTFEEKNKLKLDSFPSLMKKVFKVNLIINSGKWIIKIIVKQGDPSKVYHFAQTLRFIN